MLTLRLLHEHGEAVVERSAEEPFLALKSYEYAAGDVIELEVDRVPGLYWVQFDEALGEHLVYLTDRVIRYAAILDPIERRPYSPKVFRGPRHYLAARRAAQAEVLARRNLARNPYDRDGRAAMYPHAASNLGGEQDPAFRARNAIDGVIANGNHGSFPFQSWGTQRRDDAEFTLEFGRSVVIDEVVFFLRGDYPHDSYWTALTVELSDGSALGVPLTAALGPQRFVFAEAATTSLRLRDLVKHDDESPFPALTQIEVYGRDLERLAGDFEEPVHGVQLRRMARQPSDVEERRS